MGLSLAIISIAYCARIQDLVAMIRLNLRPDKALAATLDHAAVRSLTGVIWRPDR